jgi:hypothetical protein
MFLADPGNFDTFGYAPFVVANRYCALLHPSRSASGCEKCGNPCGVCAYAFGKGTLRYKFQGYISLEIKLLKVLIPENEETSRIRPRRVIDKVV